MSGPLTGIRVVELGGIGPVPHAGMMLADLGAEVVRVERSGLPADAVTRDFLLRGRTVVYADLKDEPDLSAVRRLIAATDVVLEGFRPGVTERLGLGPDECLSVNPGLVYARMTGYGQQGPLATAVGHDINYIGLTGALHAIGSDEPVPPLNLLGDFGGGSMYLVTGVLAALVERGRSGRGQVIDAAIVDGTASLLQMINSFRGAGDWTDARQVNILDGGAPFYRTYRCADGRHVAVGAIEPAFFRRVLEGLGLRESELPAQYDRARWPELERVLAAAFAGAPRDHWAAEFDGTTACVTPVLSLQEAATHPHLAARGTFVPFPGSPAAQAAPAPRFSRSAVTSPPPARIGDLGGCVDRWEGATTGRQGPADGPTV